MVRRLATFALVLVTSACAGQQKRSTPAFVVGHDGETFDQEHALRRAVYGLDAWTFSFDERIRGVCPGVRAPRSTLDWAATRGELRGSIVRVAECVRDGQLQDETIVIIATSSSDDPIALARAARIGEALVALGVDAHRIQVRMHEGSQCAVEIGTLSRSKSVGGTISPTNAGHVQGTTAHAALPSIASEK